MMKSDKDKRIAELEKQLAKSQQKEAQLKDKLTKTQKNVKRLKIAAQRADKKKEPMQPNSPDENLLYALIEELHDMNTRK